VDFEALMFCAVLPFSLLLVEVGVAEAPVGNENMPEVDYFCQWQ
jgi:hypothetical protein